MTWMMLWTFSYCINIITGRRLKNREIEIHMFIKISGIFQFSNKFLFSLATKENTGKKETEFVVKLTIVGGKVQCKKLKTKNTLF